MPHGNIWHWVLWLASLLFAYLTIAQGKMARRAHTCEHNERRETDVTCRDCNGKEVTIGSIVEILSWSSDRYRGLYYVVAIETGGGRTERLLLAQTRYDKWDFKVNPSRVSLRCYRPERAKGE